MKTDHQIELYKKIGFDNQYEIVTGKFFLPVAQPTPAGDDANYRPGVVVQAFAPYRVRKVVYGANKDVNPPQLPKPTDSGGFTFLGGTVQMPIPTMLTDTSMTWTVGCSYLFVENIYSDTNSGYVLGQIPFAWQSQIQGHGAVAPNAPTNIQQSGTGVKYGWNQGQTVLFTNPTYLYNEPSYYPPQFHSIDLISGPQSYQFTDTDPVN